MAIKQMLAAVLSRTQNSTSKFARSVRGRKLRKNLGMGLAIGAAALAIIAANPIVPAATAGTIRSGSGNNACTVDVGNTSYASVAQNGLYCVVSVTWSTTVTIPSYTSTIQVMAVGGGGGGGQDGGVGGGGGEIRWSASQAVTAGGTATITIGAGGAGGSWTAATTAAAGGVTYITGAGLSYGANGGAGGGGWQSTTWASGGKNGYGGTGAWGASGAIGPINPAADSTVVIGSAGSNGTAIAELTWMPTLVTSGGGGGGTCYNGQNALTTGVLGAAGGSGGGGRGANYRYNLDDVTYNALGGTAGHDGTMSLGAGGGGGMACNARDGGTSNGTYQRTNGGTGGSGLVRMAWLANKLSLSQNPDGCVSNVATPCIVPAKVQVQDSSGNNLTTAGLNITAVSASSGTPAGTTTVATDSTGVATFSNLWITGGTTGSITITFETPGYRNAVASITLYQYADTLNVVSGSTDTSGTFFGTTGIWLATASTSNVSVTTLANQLSVRDVLLRAHSASTSNGNVNVDAAASMTESASAARTLTIRASRNIDIQAGGRLASSSQPLNIVMASNYDDASGGMVNMYGTTSAYTLETKGGHVAIGGGSATMSWNGLTIPSGYATGVAATTGSWWGVQIGVNTNTAGQKVISTGGGEVRIYGKADASTNVSSLYGIAWESGIIDSGSGPISLDGQTTGSPTTAANDNWGVGLRANNSLQANDIPKIVTTGIVNMSGTVGTPGTSNYWGVAIGYADISVGSAGLNVSSSQRAIIWDGTTVSGPVNVTANLVTLSGTNSFGGNVAVTSTAGDTSIGGTQTVTGSGKSFVMKATGNVIVSASSTIQTNGGNLVLWSNTDKVAGVANNAGRVSVGSNSTLKSQGGKIWLAGGLDDGGADATITSAKGAFETVAAGDGLPDGYGVGTSVSGETPGVQIDSGYLISSAGGDIFIAGMNAPASGGGNVGNIWMTGGTVDSGTGRIGIWAKSYANGDANLGLLLHSGDNTADTNIYSANRTAKAITIYGDSSTSTNVSSDGVSVYGYGNLDNTWAYSGTHIIASGLKDSADLVNKPGGGITITGFGTSSTSANGGHGIIWQWADAIAKDGPITLTGTESDASASDSTGIYVGVDNPSTFQRFGAWSGYSTYTTSTYTDQAGNVIDMSTSDSDVTLNASRFVFIEYANAATTDGYRFKTTGDVTLQSTGASFAQAMNTTHWQFGRIMISGNPANVTIGKSTETQNINWYYDISATGTISFNTSGYMYFSTYVDLITTKSSGAGIAINVPGNTIEFNSTNIVQTSGADIKAIGDYVLFGANSKAITTATTGQGILFKANSRIYGGSNLIVQTSGADITMWTDPDNNGLGAYYFEAGSQIKSAGGKITIAGGLDDGAANFSEITGRTAGDGYPDNYAGGYSGWGANAGIDFVATAQILSGGGDIFMAGRGSATAGDDDYGIRFRGGLVYSGGGKIAMYGKSPASCANNWHRVLSFAWDSGQSTNIVSESSATDAITLRGEASSCNNGSSVYATAVSSYYYTRIAAPNGGGVKLYGSMGSASYAAGTWGNDYQPSAILELNYTQILANSGDIDIIAERTSGSGNHEIRFNSRGGTSEDNIGYYPSGDISTGVAAYPTISVPASTSDVTITGDSFVMDYARPRTTGNLVIEPFKDSFWTDQYYTTDWRAAFPTTYASVRIGKAGTNGGTQNNSHVYVDAIQSSGPISIYGNNIEARGGITTSATSGTGILLKAQGTIFLTAGTSTTSKAYSVTGTNSTAPVTLWSNADGNATADGYIYIGNYVDVTTQGGAITMGGSSAATDTSPGSYALAYTSGFAGIRMGTSNGTSNANVRVLSRGGDITMRGKSLAASSWGMLSYGGNKIDSGTGRILLDGYAIGSGNGFDFETGSTSLSTISSAAVSNATPAISITGKCDSTANGDAGQRAVYTGGAYLTVSATGGGDISMVGDNASVATTNPGSLYLVGTDVLASTGNITIDGGTDGVVTSTSGNTSDFGALSGGSATGDVLIVGDRLTAAGTTNIKTTGDVTLESKGSTFVSGVSLGNFNVVDGARNFRLGKTTNAVATSLTGGISVTGTIEVYGNGVTTGSMITSATSGNGILAKSLAGITTTAGTSGARTQVAVTGTNSTAPITFWANSDASGLGNIYIGAYTDISAKAGAITMAGSANNTETAPTGYAVGAGSGVDLGVAATATDAVTVTTTSGAITMRGRIENSSTTSAAGIQVWSGTKIASGTGSILLDGSSYRPTTSAGHAIYIGKTGGYTTTIATGASTGDAITISGIVESGPESNTNANGVIIGWATTGLNNISATGGGNIVIDGVASTSTVDSIEVNRANIYATSGDIIFDGAAKEVAFGDNGVNTIGGSTAAADHTGDVLICGGVVSFNTYLSTIRTVGATVIEPCAAATSFTAASTWGGSAVSMTTGSFRWGKAGNSANATLAGAVSASVGGIEIYGGDVTVNAGLSATTSGADILVRATGNITTAASLTFGANNGDITFWSDSDASAAGRIAFANTNTISTGGGDLTIAGGADDGSSQVAAGRTAADGYPDGWAAGNGSTSNCTAAAGTLQGVFLSNTTTITTSNGDVFIAGKGMTGATGNCASGVISNQDLWITSGTGKIAIYGSANAAASSTYSSGVNFYGNTSRKTIITSSSSAADSIVISGNAGPTASIRSSGVFFHGQTAGANVNNIVANTGTGGISITGRSVPTTAEGLADNVGDGLEMYGLGVLAKSGAITLTGTTGAGNATNRYGCSFDHSTAASLTPSQSSFGARAATTVNSVDMSSSTSDITLNCDSLINGNTTQAKQFLTTGKVAIQPADSAQSFDRDIDINGITFGSGVSELTIGQSGTGGVVSGSTQTSSNITFSTATTILGPISIYGGDITVTPNLTSNLLDARIMLKATGSIAQNAAASVFRTNSGKIVLWGDADNSTAGNITVRGTLCTATTATTCDANAATGGDDIIIGGGAADGTDSTLPGGYASGNGTGSQTATTGVQFGLMGTAATGAKIYSSGGNVLVAGQSVVTAANVGFNSFGIMLVSGTDFYAGAGKIKLNGRNAITTHGAVNVNAIELNGWGGTTRLNSTNSAADSIWIKSTSATSGNGLAAYNGGTEFNNANGGVLMQTDWISQGTTVNQFKWNVGGQIVIEPVGASFTAYDGFTTNNIWGTNAPSGFRIGKDGNTWAVTVSTPVTATGAIELIGGTVTASANLTVNTSTTAGIMLKASQDAVVGAGTNTSTKRTLQTNGGPITLWSNSDASGSGAIAMGNFSKLTSAGGAITLAGSANNTEMEPSGYARNNGSTYPSGVTLGSSLQTGNVEILSAGGDITIRGYASGNQQLGMGFFNWSGNTINSGTGAITIDGQIDGCLGTNSCHAIEFAYGTSATTLVTSAKTSGTAISVTGSSINGTSTDTTAVTVWNPMTISATAGGDIEVSGTVSSANTLAALRFNGLNLLGKGAIDIDGGTKRITFGANTAAGANVIGASAAAADAPGDITLTADNVVFFNALATFRNSGNLVIQPSSASFSEAQTLPATYFVQTGNNGFRFGKSGNTANLTIASALNFGGNVELYGGALTASSAITSTGGTITATGSTFTNTAALTTAGKDITITADQASIGAALTTASTSAGIVTVAPATVGKNLDLGATDSATLLALTDTEVDYVTAKTLRFGNATTSANINVSAAISVASGKVSNLALRGTGNVTNSNSGYISAPNLGISVGGTINLPGSNSITGNLALAASGATVSFNQNTGTYTPAAVDSIAANFGVASTVTVSQVPTATPQDAFMAVTFNPPPVVTIKDSYGNTLASANSMASGYTITATLNATSTTTGTMALAGTTSRTSSGGSATFSDLSVSGGTGTATLTFTAIVTGDLTQAAVGTAQTTGTYNVQAGDPASIAIATNAAGGKAGAAFTTQPVINIKDVAGNLVQVSPGNDLVITASLTGGTGSLVGTTTATASSSVATFSNLGISGLTSDTYSITFTATHNGTTFTVVQTGITIGFGAASALSLSTPAATVVNDVAFGTQPVVKIVDVAGNVVTDSTLQITVAANRATLGGTKTVAATAGSLTYSGLKLTGTTGDVTLTYSSGNLGTTSQIVSITHGAATQVSIAVASSLVNDTVFATQPVVTIKDVAGNTVTTGSAASQTVTLSSTDATIGGTVSMNATAGEANFTGKGVKLTGLVGARNLTATIASPSSISGTASVTITYGAATKLAVTTLATGFVNRTDFTVQPAVTIQDVSGNTVTSSTENVTATISSGTLTGTRTIPAVAGVATFSGLGKTGTVGSKTITFSSGVLATDSQTFVLTFGAATQVAVALPSSVANAVALSAQPIATIQDADGNTVTSGSQSSQTVTLSSSDATISGTVSMPAVGGVADFDGKGITLTGTVGTRTISAAITSPSAISGSATLSLTHGAATQVSIAVASSLVNDTVFATQPVVTIKDVSGNTVTTGSDASQTVTLSSTDATIGGTVSMNATTGEADFAGKGVKLTGLVGARNLTATIASPSSISGTASVTITYGAATKLAVTTLAAGFVNRADFSTQPAVTIQDVSGNAVTSATDVVSVAISNGNLTGTTTATAVAGVATFSGLGKNGTVGSKTLTFSSGSLAVDTQTFALTYGAVYKLDIAAPSSAASGTVWGTQPVVTIQDQDGNTVTSAVDNITLTSPDSTIAGTTSMAAVAGVADFIGKNIKLSGISGTKSLVATGASQTATAYVSLGFGSPYQTVLTTSAAGFKNRTAMTTNPVVEVRDQAGNVVTNYTGNVTVSFTTAGASITGTTKVAAVAGIATFSGLGVQGTVGNYTIKYLGAFGGSWASQTITVTHGDAASINFHFSQWFVNGQTLGPSRPGANIADADGNLVTTGAESTMPVVFSSTDMDIYGVTTINAVAGQATLGTDVYVGATIGTRHMTVTTTTPTALTATGTVDVREGAVHHVAFVQDFAGAKAGLAMTTQAKVRFEDFGNNPISNNSVYGIIRLTTTGQFLDGTQNYQDQFSTQLGTPKQFSGVGLKGATGTYTITAVGTWGPTSIAVASDSMTISLNHGNVHHLTFDAMGSTANDNVMSPQPVVRLYDEWNNLVDTGSEASQNVTLLPTAPATFSAGTATVAASAGVADFTGQGLALRGTIGATNIRATAVTSNKASYGSVTITHGAATKLGFGTQAAGANSRANFGTQPVVQVQDVSGNLVPTATGTVTASLVGATLTGTNTATITNGVATFTDLGAYGTIGAKTLNFEATGVAAVSQSLTLAHGAAYQLAVAAPSTNVNDVALTTQPVVTIQDQDGNTVTTTSQAGQTVTLSSSDATIGGTLSMAATAGVANFTGKGIKLTGLVGPRNLRATITSPGTITGNATVNITFGAATQLSLKTPAVGFVNRQAFGTQPVIEVQDVSGNAVTDSTITIEASASAGNGAVLGGTLTRTASSGEADFGLNASGLKLSGAVGSYTLTFGKQGGGLTPATQTITLVHSDAASLAVVTPAASATTGADFGAQPALKLVDVDGNLVATGAGSTATVTASLSGVGTASLSGTLTATATGGNLAFNNLRITGDAGSYTLTYAVTSPSSLNTISTTQSIAVGAGAAVALVVVQQPSTVQTRATMTPAPTVSLRDAWNNPVTTDSSTGVTVQLIDSTGTAASTESAAVTASSGVVTFSSIAYQTTPADGYRLRFKLAGTSTTVNSSAFTVNPGAATELRITSQPSAFDLSLVQSKTGEVLGGQPTVKLYDQDGNLVTTTNTGAATIAIASTSGLTLADGSAARLSEGTVTANFVGGVATFSGVKLTGLPGTAYKLKFTAGALTSVDSNDVTVTHNVADHLAVQQGFAGGRAGVGFSTPAIVRILDRYGNLVNTGSQSSTVIRTAVSAGGSLMGGTQVPAVGGAATFSSLILGGSVSGSYKITFSTTNSAITVAEQPGITLTFGYADHITVTTQPVAAASGANQTASGSDLAVQPVVEVRDAYGNLVTDATDTITVSIASTQVLTLADGSAARIVNPSIDAVSGVATFAHLGLIGLPGVDYTLGFEDYGLNPVQAAAPVQVTHAAAHHLTVTAAPTGGNPTGTNLAGQPTVQLRDRYENVVTANSSLVVTAAISSTAGLTLADASAARLTGATATVASGVATWQNLKLFGLPNTDYQLTFSANAVTSSAATANLRVTFAAADHLTITRQPVASVTGSTLSTQPIVEVRDQFENLVADSTATVSAAAVGAGAALTSAANIGPSALDAVAVGGVATFTDLILTATPSTNFQLRFTSNALTSATSSNVSVAADAPYALTIQAQPVGAITGDALQSQPVIRVEDRFGNVVTQDSSTVVTVAIASGAGGSLFKQPTAALTATASNGIVTFSGLRLQGVPLRDYTLRFTSGSLQSVDSVALHVVHAAASQLTIETEAAGNVIGDALTTQPVLNLRDFDGNLATSNNSTVVTATVTTTDGNHVLTQATAAAVGGVVTFSNLTLVGTPHFAYKLTYSAGGYSVASNASITLMHARPDAIVVQNGSTVTANLSGEALTSQPVLRVLDRFGNLAETDNTTVVTASILNDVTGSVSGTTTATAVNGIVTFSGLRTAGVPGTVYRLAFAGNYGGTALTGINSNTFTMSKVADVALTYVNQVYVPVGAAGNLVSPAFSTDSPGAVTYTTSAPSTICTVNASTGVVSIKGVGACPVTATVAATTYYRTASATYNFTIAKAPQAAVVLSLAGSVDYWSTTSVSASGGSGNGAISISTNGTCSIVGSTLIPGDAGSLCQVTATRAGDANYLPESSNTQTVMVNKINQAPLTMANAATVTVGDLTLFTAGGSGSGSISYQVVSAGTAGCAVTGDQLSASTNGTCSVRANKAASTNFNAVVGVTQTITVNKLAQSVAFTSLVPMYPVANGTYAMVASATSTLAVTYSVVTGAGTVCSIDSANAAQVNFLAAGTCEVRATQAGNTQYAAASSTQTIEVGQLNQSITMPVLTNKTFGAAPFAVRANSNSGLTVTVAVGPNTTNGSCSYVNGIVTILAAGLCELIADQAGNNTYAAATSVARSFTIDPVSAGAPFLATASATDKAFTVTYTAPSYTGGSPIVGYRLVVSDGQGNEFVNEACATSGVPLSCEVIGLTNGTAYTAKIAAITAFGVGDFSADSLPQTAATAPLAVSSIKAYNQAGNLAINWDQPAALDSAFTSYQVYVAAIGTEFSATPIDTITNFSTVNTVIPANQLPDLDAAISTSSLRSASVGGFGRASIRHASVASPSSAPAPAVRGYKVKIVTVTAISIVESSGNSSQAVNIPAAAPGAPNSLALAKQADGSLLITWSAPSNDGGQPIVDYRVDVNGQVECTSVTIFMCTLPSVTRGNQYSIAVSARNLTGDGAAATQTFYEALPQAPVVTPTPTPTLTPTPTSSVTPSPSVTPTKKPTPKPTKKPTVKPTKPVVGPTSKPTVKPTTGPSASPSESSSVEPSASPSATETETPVVPSESTGSGFMAWLSTLAITLIFAGYAVWRVLRRRTGNDQVSLKQHRVRLWSASAGAVVMLVVTMLLAGIL